MKHDHRALCSVKCPLFLPSSPQPPCPALSSPHPGVSPPCPPIWPTEHRPKISNSTSLPTTSQPLLLSGFIFCYFLYLIPLLFQISVFFFSFFFIKLLWYSWPPRLYWFLPPLSYDQHWEESDSKVQHSSCNFLYEQNVQQTSLEFWYSARCRYSQETKLAPLDILMSSWQRQGTASGVLKIIPLIQSSLTQQDSLCRSIDRIWNNSWQNVTCIYKIFNPAPHLLAITAAEVLLPWGWICWQEQLGSSKPQEAY